MSSGDVSLGVCAMASCLCAVIMACWLCPSPTSLPLLLPHRRVWMWYYSSSPGCLHHGMLTVPLKKSSVLKLSYKCGSDMPSFTWWLWFLQINRGLRHLCRVPLYPPARDKSNLFCLEGPGMLKDRNGGLYLLNVVKITL